MNMAVRIATQKPLSNVRKDLNNFPLLAIMLECLKSRNQTSDFYNGCLKTINYGVRQVALL